MKKLAGIITVLIFILSFASAEELNADISKAVGDELVLSVSDGTEAWAAFLLKQKVSVEIISEGNATVSVPAWFPGEDGSTEDDIAQSIKSSAVTGNIRYGFDETGALSVFGTDSFRRKIVSAASDAKSAFRSQWLESVVLSALFPEVYAAEGGYTRPFKLLEAQYADISPMTLEAAFSMLSPSSLNANSGPKALKIDISAANISSVARSAYIAAYDILKNSDKSNSFSREKMSEILWDCFIKSSACVTDEDYTQSLEANADMESILSGDHTLKAVADYAARIDEELNDKLDTLQIAASYLPDYPARNQPESGVLKGPISGTHVAFYAPDDGYGRIINLLIPETGQAALTLFIRSGDSVDAYVPSGFYLLECGKGSEWYGEIKRFGSNACYASSVISVEIAQSDKYHVINIVGDDPARAEGIKIPMRSEAYVEPD